MKFVYITIGACLTICLSLTVFGLEFPGSKEEQKVVSIMADEKVMAEVKILVPSTIEASGSDVSFSSGGGGKHTMRINDGSVEIRPEKGKPITITGEMIYVYGYGKRDSKK